MKIRVERERTDNGWGWGWVVLDEVGELLAVCATWHRAMVRARLFVRFPHARAMR